MKGKWKQLVTTAVAVISVSVYATTAFAAGGTLSIYTWANQFAPELISKFEKQTGIDVTIDAYNSNAAVLTKLQAGGSGYDIVTPSQHYVKIMIEQKLLKDVDMYKLEGFKQLSDRWT